MRKNEHGLGTVRKVINYKTGAVIGYQAILPREFSTPPPNCKNPKAYQGKIGPRVATEAEARKLLNDAIVERIEIGKLKNGRTFSAYVREEMDDRYLDAKEIYKAPAAAHASMRGWRSADRVYFSKAEFYNWPPARIEVDTLQQWFDWLSREARTVNGGRLCRGYVQNIAAKVRAVFARAKVKPNPMDSVDLLSPLKKEEVEYLTLEEQMRFFREPEIDIMDRVMAGCGMGAGLRIGELLSLEATDLHLDDHDPYLWVRYGGAHRSPPKARNVKRVELFEPGLGFFRLWMRDHYRPGNRLVFGGPRGGYQAGWVDNFASKLPGDRRNWSDLMGRHIDSHETMRHTYAVAMLSGTWGYEPQTLDFIKEQLRHETRDTTEKYYARFEIGAMPRQVRHFTGREPRPPMGKGGITAAALLGLDAQIDARTSKLPQNIEFLSIDRQPSNSSVYSGKVVSIDAAAHQQTQGLARDLLQALEAGEPLTLARVSDLARGVLALLPEPSAEQAEEARHG